MNRIPACDMSLGQTSSLTWCLRSRKKPLEGRRTQIPEGSCGKLLAMAHTRMGVRGLYSMHLRENQPKDAY